MEQLPKREEGGMTLMEIIAGDATSRTEQMRYALTQARSARESGALIQTTQGSVREQLIKEHQDFDAQVIAIAVATACHE